MSGSIGAVGAKVIAVAFSPASMRDDAVGLGEDAQAVHVEERLRLRRQLAEAVGDLLEQRVDLLGLAALASRL